jgi:hypothetical protein
VEKKKTEEKQHQQKEGERERGGVPVLLREGFFSNWNNSSF